MNNFIKYLGKGKVKEVLQFRVEEDCDLVEALTEVVKENNIKSAVIISGLGALKKAVCRNLKWFPEKFPVKVSDRLYYEIEKPLELLSLSGWVAGNPDGEPVVHAHFSVSTVEDEQVQAFGGHLSEGTITGIKVVVAMLILEEDNFYADIDESTRSNDLFCKG